MAKRFGIGTLVFASCVSVILVITIFFGSYIYFHERAEYARLSGYPGQTAVSVPSGPSVQGIPHNELMGYLTGMLAGIVCAAVLSFLLSFFFRREFLLFSRSFERATLRQEPVSTGRLALSDFHDLAVRMSRIILDHKAADEAHRAAEEKFGSVFHASPFSAIIFDDETREIIDVNDTLTNRMGYSREEMMGKKLEDFNPWADAGIRDAIRREYADNGRVSNREAEFTIRSGEKKKVLISMERITIGGRPATLAMLNDITLLERTRGELVESERRYQHLIEHMETAFANHRIVVDGSGTPIDYVFEEVNGSFERMMGLGRADIIGKRVTEVIPGIREGSFDWVGFYGRVALTGEPAGVEQYVESLGKWFSVSAYSHTPGYFAVTFFDITQRRRTESDLRAQMAETERFNRLATARESRVMELKKRVNELAVRVGETPPFGEIGDDGEPYAAETTMAPDTAVREDAPGETRLGDIFDRAQMQTLLDSLCDSLGISSGITDTKGNTFVESRWKRVCRDFHRKNEETRARCVESDTASAFPEKNGGGCSVYRCRNGLTDAAVPIMVNGTHVGNVFVGQFLTEPADMDYFREQAREFGFDEGEYLDAVREVTVIPGERLTAIIRFMAGFASLAGQMGMERIHDRARREDFLRWSGEMDRVNRELDLERKAALSLAEDAEEARGRLQESEQRFRTLTENSLTATYIIQDGVFKYINPALTRLFGGDAATLLGTNPMDVIHPYDRAFVTDNLRKRLAGETVPNRYEFHGVRANGEIVLIEVIADLVEYDGRPAVLGNLIDITERRKAEDAVRESREKLNAILEYSPMPISWASHEGTIEFVNRRFTEVFGYTRDEIPTIDAWYARAYPDPVYRDEMRRKWEGSIAEHVRSGTEIPSFEVDIACADGSVRTVVVISSLVSGVVIVMMNDITERKHAETALDYQLRLLNTLLDTLPVGVFMVDASSGKPLVANERAKDLLGRGILPDATRENLAEVYEAYRSGTNEPYPTEEMPIVLGMRGVKSYIDDMRVRRPDGTESFIEVFGCPVLDATGSVTASLVTFADITERKRAEEERDRTAAYHAALLELSRMVEEPEETLADFALEKAVELTGSAIGYFAFLNEDETVLEMYSWSKKALETCCMKNPPKRYHLEKTGLWGEAVRQRKPVVTNDYAAENPYKKGLPEGHVPLVRHMNVPVFDGGKIVIVAGVGNKEKPYTESDERRLALLMDGMWKIVKRRRAEEALSLSHFSIERSMDATFRVGSDGRFLSVNEAACRSLEYTREELLAMTVSDIDPGFPPDKWKDHWKDLLERKSFAFETVHRAKSGRLFPVDMSVNYIEYGGTGYNFAYSRDITEKVRAREALTAEKERLAVTLGSIGDGVITTDREGRIALMNRVAEALTGWTQETAAGRPIGEVFVLLDEKTRNPIENPAFRALSEGTVVELPVPAILVARDGHEIVVADSGAPIRDAGSVVVGMVIVFRDVTERRKMEEEVLKTQKLEAVGVLAGGIAHDFNNILTGILGALSVARITIAEDNEARETILGAERELLRARDLTAQLLTFSKGGEPVRDTVSIAEMVTETVRFVLRGSSVKGVFDFQAGLKAANVDISQLSRVIHNLALNAVQAMPQGGILRVVARNVTVGMNDPLPLDPGDYIQLDIRDTGTGIPREELSKIFDPYFTTKEKGSGLGLAVTYSIISRHRGHISVESVVGKGTVFHIHLPAADRTAEREEKSAGDVTEKGTGRILVMDDEESVRSVVAKIGGILGYEIETAEDGDMAVAMFREAKSSGRPFDAVIMDLTVPGGMGGKDAAGVLLSLDPDAKIIVSSGYSTDPIMSDYEKYGFSGVLVKPYRVEEFARMIRGVLNRREPAVRRKQK